MVRLDNKAGAVQNFQTKKRYNNSPVEPSYRFTVLEREVSTFLCPVYIHVMFPRFGKFF